MGVDRVEDWEQLDELARAAYEDGDLVKAEEYLVRASALPGVGATVWGNLGLVRMAREDYLGAVAAYSESVGDIPTDRANRGLAYERLGDVRAARSEYRALLEQVPNDVDTLVNLGTLELAQGHRSRAQKRLEHAAQLDPTANWPLSDVYVARGELDRAVLALQKAIEAGEERALLDLARIENGRGNVSAARVAYQRAIERRVDGAAEEYATFQFAAGENWPT